MNEPPDSPPHPPPYGERPSASAAPPAAGDPPSGPSRARGGAGEEFVRRVRQLRRSRTERVVAGVCGGVARDLGIDPLLLRVVLAVLVLFGGSGIVLYALGWLLLPVDDGEPSLAARAVDRGRGRPSTQTVLLAVGLTIAVTIGVLSVFGHWDGLLLALVVAGLIAIVLRQQDRAPQTTWSQTGADSTTPYPPAYQQSPPAYQQSAAQTLPYGTPPSGPPGPGDQGPQGPGSHVPQPPAPPRPPRPPRERSMLPGLTVSAALIGLGALAAVDVAGADVSGGAYVALALAILGLGLLVGAWIGRARGIIWIGVVLAVLTVALSLSSPWHDRRGPDSAGDVALRPTSVAELPTSGDFGAGQVTYDLRDVPFTDQAASMAVRVGFGEIVVTVPPDVDVTVRGQAGLGGLDLFGTSNGGFGADQTVTDLGSDGAGGGTLNLDLEAGFGHLEVRRAQA